MPEPITNPSSRVPLTRAGPFGRLGRACLHLLLDVEIGSLGGVTSKDLSLERLKLEQRGRPESSFRSDL